MQEYIWAHCFRQAKGASQELIDCESPLSDDEAGQLLGVYQASPTLLAHLREWMSVMGISAIVVESMKGDSTELAEALKVAARG